MTLNDLMVRFQQCWSFGECGVPLHCHCSRVQADTHLQPELIQRLKVHCRYQFGPHSLHNTLTNSQQLARGPSFSPMSDSMACILGFACMQPLSTRAVHLTLSICTVTAGSAPFGEETGTEDPSPCSFPGQYRAM